MERWSGLSNENDQSMSHYMLMIYSVLLLAACHSESSEYLQSSQVKLSPPQFSIENIFFKASTSITLLPSEKGSKICYTQDGSMPNQHSSTYKTPLKVTQSGTFNFMACADQFINSEVVEVQLFKIKDIQLEKTEVIKASEQYPGSANNLFDQKKGDFNFRSTAWKGFEAQAFIHIDLYEGQEINGLVISSLVDHNSWIFGPEEIRLTYVYADGKEIDHVATFPEVNKKDGKAKMEFSRIAAKASQAIKISIHIKGPEVIPDWHPGAGKKGWLFLDEVVFL